MANLVKAMKNSERDPLTPLIDTYLAKRQGSDSRLQEWTIQIPERPRPGGRLSPSAIGGCQRAAALKFIGFVPTKKIVDPDTELIFEDGNWRHHKWDAMFYDMEAVLGKDVIQVVEIERQVQIPELYVAGSLDITIKVKIGGKWRRIVIDFKGANDYAFHRIHVNNAPLEGHEKQLFTYMVARGVKRGMLLYDNKNNQQFKVFTYEFDPTIWAATERWCNRVISQLEKRQLPGRHQNCNSGNFLFEKCPFASFCYGKHREDRDALRRIAFKDFVGVDEAWEAGLAEAS